jgi:hypothetical protein
VIRCRLIGIPLAEINHIMAGGDFFIHLFHQGSEKLLRSCSAHLKAQISYDSPAFEKFLK